MSKSIKLKNNAFIDSTGIVHNKKILADILYPVGSIYLSVNSTSPADLFGGTWEQITNKFLYCTTTSNTTGGSNSVEYTPTGNINGHTLTIDEIPSHTHKVDRYDSVGLNNHPISSGNNYQGICAEGSPSARMTTTGAGGGKAHGHGFTGTKATINTMPAYYTVYCWRRTA